MPARSNLSVLTQSHQAIASKKRAKQEQVKEVVFDDDARRWVHYSIFSRPFLT
jgi:ribosomal RNA-processing protein 17